MLLALPILIFMAQREGSTGPTPTSAVAPWRWAILAGVFFAGDLAFWHWSIGATSVANATILTNLAPVFVAFAAWPLFGERPTFMSLASLGLALFGAWLLVDASLAISPERAIGDLLGLSSAVFYAAYQLSIRRVRGSWNTWRVMVTSSLVSGITLAGIAVASGESLVPGTMRAWAVVFALAVISQVLGQGLIAYALLHVPSGFSSLTLLMQALVATILGWWVLGEALGPAQLLGGAVLLSAIVIARRSTSAYRMKPTRPSTSG